MMTSACRRIMGQDNNRLITVVAQWQRPSVSQACAPTPGGGLQPPLAPHSPFLVYR